MHTMPKTSFDLFSEAIPSSAPVGFAYSDSFIQPAEESALIDEIEALELTPYEFRGVDARRRVVSFGFRHGYQSRRLEQTSDIPSFLAPLRSKAAAFAGVFPEDFRQVLVTEYTPGTPIGWHKDRDQYEKVVGVSLLSAATLRFRRELEGRWLRQSQILEPRSVYLLSGPARDLWQHSIPPVAALRFSVTFRTLRQNKG